jgi:hypothetical protein
MSWNTEFLGVILSDERSEESKEPFGRRASSDLRLRHAVPHCDFWQQ